MKRYFLLKVMVLLTMTHVFSQTDTEFWFAVPRVTLQHEGDVIYRLKITSFGQPSDYRVSIPSTGAVITQGTVNANSIVNVLLSRDQLKNETPNTVYNKGILVTGTNPITCYFEIEGQQNGEIYSLKGKNALGTEFIVPTQKFYPHPITWYSGDDHTAFDIVATEDNTQITVTPSNNVVAGGQTGTGNAGVPFTITLNKGQTYSIRARSRDELGALGGTIVTSNKPIAITITEDSMLVWHDDNNKGADVIGDQIIPVAVAGNQYIAIRGDISTLLSMQEGVQVWGTQDATQITVVRSATDSSTYTLNRGTSQLVEIEGAVGTSVFIKADKPVLAYHVTGLGPGSYEIGSAVMPPVLCTGSRSVAFTRMTEQGNCYLLLMTRNRYKDGFVFTSGTNTITIDPAEFRPVAGSDSLVSACIIYGTSGSGVLANVQSIVTNTKGVFHLGIINGIASDNTQGTAIYGYFSDFGMLASATNDTKLFPDCEVVLSAAPGMDSYRWEMLPAGNYLSDNDSLFLPQGSVGELDTFTVTTRHEGCTYVETFYVEYAQPQAGLTDTICTLADSIEVDVSENWYKSLLWEDQDTLARKYLTAGSFAVTFFDYNNCSKTDTFKVAIVPQANPLLAPYVEFCPENTTELNPGECDYCTFHWSTGDTSRVITAASEKAQKITYIVTVSNNSTLCPQTATAQTEVNFLDCEIEPVNVFTPNGDGINDHWYVKHVENRVWEVTIFNRWGRKVYESRDYQNNWDGGGVSDGVYYYIIRTYELDTEAKHGYVHIVR